MKWCTASHNENISSSVLICPSWKVLIGRARNWTATMYHAYVCEALEPPSTSVIEHMLIVFQSSSTRLKAFYLLQFSCLIKINSQLTTPSSGQEWYNNGITCVSMSQNDCAAQPEIAFQTSPPRILDHCLGQSNPGTFSLLSDKFQHIPMPHQDDLTKPTSKLVRIRTTITQMSAQFKVTK